MLSPGVTFDKDGSPSDMGKTSDINRMIVCKPDSSDGLNLRESADSRSASLGKYYTGIVVCVTKTTDVEWVMALIGTESGFMNTKYLVPYTEEAARNGSAMLPKARVSNVGGTGLYLRGYATTGSKVLKIIPNGESLTVLGVTANGWACVQTGDTIGYVDADKLSPAVTFEK